MAASLITLPFVLAFMLFVSMINSAAINITVNPMIDTFIPEQHKKGWKAPINPLDPSTYNGDVLNVTKCYCQDPSDAIRKGHFYQFDYFNWHSNQYFTADKLCDSRKHSTFVGRHWQPHCWSQNGFDIWNKYCGHENNLQNDPYPHHDKFCFQIASRRSVMLNWTNWDYYMFNGQKRSLISAKSWFELDNSVCRSACPTYLPGMVLAEDSEGSSAVTVRGPIDHYVMRSTVISYPDLDDMCNGCKKLRKRSDSWMVKARDAVAGLIS